MWKYFLYQLKRFWKSLLSPSVTVQYPFVRRQKSPGLRNSFRLDPKECTGCLDCEKVCPAEAISLTTREFVDELVLPESSNGHIFQRKVLQLKVDYGKCFFCMECVEHCRPRALSAGRELPRVGEVTGDLVDGLLKSKELPRITWRKSETR